MFVGACAAVTRERDDNTKASEASLAPIGSELTFRV